MPGDLPASSKDEEFEGLCSRHFIESSRVPYDDVLHRALYIAAIAFRTDPASLAGGYGSG